MRSNRTAAAGEGAVQAWPRSRSNKQKGEVEATARRYHGMAAKLYRWEIAVIRKRGEVIDTVEAPDADTAIKLAIEKWGIADPERQKRLAAHRIG
jgi:hypothetical protein